MVIFWSSHRHSTQWRILFLSKWSFSLMPNVLDVLFLKLILLVQWPSSLYPWTMFDLFGMKLCVGFINIIFLSLLSSNFLTLNLSLHSVDNIVYLTRTCHNLLHVICSMDLVLLLQMFSHLQLSCNISNFCGYYVWMPNFCILCGIGDKKRLSWNSLLMLRQTKFLEHPCVAQMLLKLCR